MERLTERVGSGCGAYVRVKGSEGMRDVLKAIEILADYEDTGYTPEQIEALKTDSKCLQEIANLDGLIAGVINGLTTENQRLKADCESMREMIAEYCAKVEDGKIRDNGLYCKFWETLNTLQEG